MKPWDTARAFQVCGEETPIFGEPKITFVVQLSKKNALILGLVASMLLYTISTIVV